MRLFLLTALSCAVWMGCSSSSTCDGGTCADASMGTDSGGDSSNTQDSGAQDAAKDSGGD